MSRVYASAGLEYFGRLRNSPAYKRVLDLMGLAAAALIVVGTILLLLGD